MFLSLMVRVSVSSPREGELSAHFQSSGVLWWGWWVVEDLSGNVMEGVLLSRSKLGNGGYSNVVSQEYLNTSHTGAWMSEKQQH